MPDIKYTLLNKTGMEVEIPSVGRLAPNEPFEVDDQTLARFQRTFGYPLGAAKLHSGVVLTVELPSEPVATDEEKETKE